jgi:FKBP-type peptidyl-prolyl cis-trans isomerase FkpA
MKNGLYFFLIAAVISAGCSKTPTAEDDQALIEKYLLDNNLTATTIDRGVYVIINEPGEEAKPQITSTVTVYYRGYYLDGTQFDGTQTGGAPARFALSNVIEGWQIGIRKFGKGGKGTILIPSRLGYGKNPPFGVRSNAVLIFDIELVDFN